MEASDPELPYRERMFKFVKDPELDQLDEKYEAFLDLHNIETVSELYDVVEASKYNALTGKLVWTIQRDLPIELKRDIIRIYSKYFVD